ncbi:MAG: hypothetical protein KatS3mg101_0845 [Patescibacteria group bacterium]|nr:MAG: hypothetical protein KatS3mg101_0845 [Patescibacteria group bacterium]
MYRHSFDEIKHGKIKAVSVSLLSHEELSSLKLVVCNNPEYEGLNSPNDPRLGTVEPGSLCYSCHQTPFFCPGHLGMIELNEWFIHPKLTDVAIKILMSICNSCASLLIPPEVIDKLDLSSMSFQARLREIANMSVKIKRCTNKSVDPLGIKRPCLPNPKFFPLESKGLHVVICEYKNGVKLEKKVKDIYDLFSRMDERSIRALGFTGKTHPKDLIIRSFPVIPPRAIPRMYRDDKILYDHITSAYVDIIRQNNLLKTMLQKQVDHTDIDIKRVTRNIYFYMSHLIDNNDKKYTRSREEPIQSLVERLTNKDGLIRSSVMGKRVNFVSRAVLGPYNKVEFGKIVCPSVLKRYHTLPIAVCKFNIGYLNRLYRSGKVVNLILPNGNIYEINNNTRDKHKLTIGATVEVEGKNGDEVIFNRQPTLDKQSIMGYRVQYLDDYYCFGLHSSYTTPHNADFDGDEGNLHKIQNVEARAEIRHIVSVENCLMNPKTNSPTFGLVYNCVSAAYLLSKTNPDLFSVLLPEDFCYKKGDLVIKNGKIVSGYITKEHIGTSDGSIMQRLYKEYGKKRAVKFLTEGQILLDQFLMYYGLSVGYSSIIPKNASLIEKLIDNMIDKAKMRIVAIKDETKILNSLNMVSRIGQRISLKALDELSPLNVMCRSGAKGKEVNIAQIIGCLGQQYIFGSRPEKSFTLGSRCLSYFEPHSEEIESRGFVRNSFEKGLDVTEFIFHMMASRVGLMDSALKTADIGHLHHKIVKSMEDIVLEYDGTARNCNGIVIDFMYGFYSSELTRRNGLLTFF